MGQREIYDFLKQNPNHWYSTEDIGTKSDPERSYDRQRTSKLLNKMIKFPGIFPNLEVDARIEQNKFVKKYYMVKS